MPPGTGKTPRTRPQMSIQSHDESRLRPSGTLRGYRAWAWVVEFLFFAWEGWGGGGGRQLVRDGCRFEQSSFFESSTPE